MAWNFLVVEIVPDDRLLRPTIGHGDLTRDEAHHEIQAGLDRVPAFNAVAALWRRGAQDDTVYWGPYSWAIYEHPAGQDPRLAALAWLEDLAVTMRAAGVDVQVPQQPRRHP